MKDLESSMRRLSYFTAALLLAFMSVAIVGFVVEQHRWHQTRASAASTKHALCVLRDELELRIENSRQFLILHPNGILGITPALLQKSIHDQQGTIDALAGLNCDGGEVAR